MNETQRESVGEFSVFVDSLEVNGHYLTFEKAIALGLDYGLNGYDFVSVMRMDKVTNEIWRYDSEKESFKWHWVENENGSGYENPMHFEY